MYKKETSLFGVSKIRSSSSAFTIVELLVVIVVIGILAAITIVSYTGISSRATVSSLQSDLTNALTQLKLDQVNSSSSAFPATLALANGGKGISSSSGTTYTYAVSNTTTPQTFCITATKNNISYNITGDGNPQPGICPVLNLDAGNISSYPGTGTTWTDLSGNGNSGVLINGVGFYNSDVDALIFDGANDYVVTTAKINTLDFTISSWIKVTNYPAGEGWIINQYGDGASSGRMIISLTSTGALRIFMNSLAVYGSVIAKNVWVNVVGGRRVDGTGFLYINGILNNTGNISTVGIYNVPIIVGAKNDGTNGFNGYVSNAVVYNRALSDDETMQNFNAFRGRYGI